MLSRHKPILASLLVVALAAALLVVRSHSRADRVEQVATRVAPELEEALKEEQLRFGAPVFMRIFKESNELELWMKAPDGRFQLFRTYEICRWSGSLGPKLKEGDRQSPEGFYQVTPDLMNPRSRFHLSFNLGFPNDFDRSHGRTGSHLMVHGACVSIGCYAMTDKRIEEIYPLAAAALNHGQPFFSVHCFPFRMTEENLARHRGSKWESFWANLKSGYDWFEEERIPPSIAVSNGRYAINPPASSKP